MTVFHTCRRVGFLVAVLWCPSVVLASDAFILAIAPHSSPRVLVEMYTPLHDFLEKAIGRPVETVTAPGYTEFARRALRQEYDLAVTTGHQARLLEADAQYLPLLTYLADFRAVAMVAKDGPVLAATDLQNADIIGLSETSFVTMWGQRWLHQANVQPHSVKYISASDSVAQLILTGEAMAGFVSLANFQRLPDELRAKLRLVAESDPMAGRVYMLNAKHTKNFQTIKAALLEFAKTPEAISYFSEHKLGGYRDLRPSELLEVDLYTDAVRKFIRENNN